MAAGFEGFELTWRKNIFEGALRPSQAVANYGTCGINFRAHKPDRQESKSNPSNA